MAPLSAASSRCENDGGAAVNLLVPDYNTASRCRRERVFSAADPCSVQRIHEADSHPIVQVEGKRVAPVVSAVALRRCNSSEYRIRA
jgi:hypothetical protein